MATLLVAIYGMSPIGFGKRIYGISIFRFGLLGWMSLYVTRSLGWLIYKLDEPKSMIMVALGFGFLLFVYEYIYRYGEFTQNKENFQNFIKNKQEAASRKDQI